MDDNGRRRPLSHSYAVRLTYDVVRCVNGALISVLNLGLQIFLLWPRKPLSLPSSMNKTLRLCLSLVTVEHFNLNTSIKSHGFLRLADTDVTHPFYTVAF